MFSFVILSYPICGWQNTPNSLVASLFPKHFIPSISLSSLHFLAVIIYDLRAFRPKSANMPVLRGMIALFTFIYRILISFLISLRQRRKREGEREEERTDRCRNHSLWNLIICLVTRLCGRQWRNMRDGPEWIWSWNGEWESGVMTMGEESYEKLQNVLTRLMWKMKCDNQFSVLEER